jgi:predicted ester cyclase
MADLTALVRKGNDAFNDRDEATARSLMAANVAFRAPGMPEVHGIDAAIEFDKVWWAACSDARSELLQVASAGDDTVLVRGHFRGTHDGVMRTPMGEIPATGKTIEGKFSQVFKFDGDKVVDAEILFDRMQVMEDLGLVPEPATA